MQIQHTFRHRYPISTKDIKQDDSVIDIKFDDEKITMWGKPIFYEAVRTGEIVQTGGKKYKLDFTLESFQITSENQIVINWRVV